jgi:hypothetical protein
MKAEEKILLVEDFLINFVEWNEYTQKDIYDWIDKYYNGLRPDHNKFFEIRNVLYIFSVQSRGGVFKLNILKAEEFLKNNKEKINEFKNKLKGVKK